MPCIKPSLLFRVADHGRCGTRAGRHLSKTESHLGPKPSNRHLADRHEKPIVAIPVTRFRTKVPGRGFKITANKRPFPRGGRSLTNR